MTDIETERDTEQRQRQRQGHRQWVILYLIIIERQKDRYRHRHRHRSRYRHRHSHRHRLGLRHRPGIWEWRQLARPSPLWPVLSCEQAACSVPFLVLITGGPACDLQSEHGTSESQVRRRIPCPCNPRIV